MKTPRALITGIAGFAGSYLAEELLLAGFDVSGTLYPGESTHNIYGIKPGLHLVKLDILNEKKCRDQLKHLDPDYIFHLAALASVGKSFELEKDTFRVNFEGTINLLAASCDVKRLKSFLFVSSPEVFGQFRPVNKTLTESHPFDPISPYGISKAAAENACRYYWRQHNVPVIIARAFNHTGPRQTPDFAVPAFACQVAVIEAGLQKPVLKVGDLSARRDLSDVRDIVRGYRLAATKGKPGEVYQLCSGKSVALQDVVEQMLAMSSSKIKLQVDRTRLRKAEIPVLRGSNRKATNELGYTVRYKLRDTIADTLNFWREQIGDSESN
jgi:GDP-4-dehydro-6-deoxy-D-mannose reductase